MINLYHGSATNGITVLKPSPNSSAVYFTPNRAYALFYIRDIKINWVTCGVTETGILRYEERFPGQLAVLYDGMRGFIYRAKAGGDFIPANTRSVWKSYNPVVVEVYEYVQNAYEEILRCEAVGEAEIVRYETLCDNARRGVFDMMTEYILRNGLLNTDTVKTRFLQKHFPAEWSYAESHQCRTLPLLKKINAKKPG